MSDGRNDFLLCRDCGYDLRAARDRCPECGLDVATSRDFPGFVRAGAVWTRRVLRRFTIACVLVVLVIAIIATSISLESSLVATYWLSLAILNAMPFVALAAIPMVLAIRPPASLGHDWPWTRRACIAGALMSLAACVAELFHYRMLSFQNGTSLWVMIAIGSAIQCAMMAVLPLCIMPISRLLPAPRVTTFLRVCVAAGGSAALLGLVNHWLLFNSDRNAYARVQMPVQLTMAACLLMSLIGSLVLVFVIRSRIKSQYRRMPP